MKKLFIHVSLQRCGCHAISNWLLKQRDGFAEAQLEPMVDGVYSLPHQGIPTYFFNHQDFSKSILEQRKKALKNIEFPCDVMICFETGSIVNYDEEKLLGDIFEGYEIIRIISLRDVWNCYSSFYKKYYTVDPHIRNGWEERAEEILGKTKFLKGDWNFVNYNCWFTNKEYRKELCDKFGLLFTDRGLDDVPSFGNGSSFDKRTKHRNASSMNVLSRYREYENDLRFMKFMTPYAQMLSKEIFKYEHRPDE